MNLGGGGVGLAQVEYKAQMWRISKCEATINQPVVLLSDGHSSRFDIDVLIFLKNKQIQLFITPPNITDITQLLDQVNQKLHSKYQATKTELFPNQ